MAPRAVFFGCAGSRLDVEEKAFFRESNPLGFILFQRNCVDPQQVNALTSELRECVGRDAPILIDQEGGRVQRLRPPHWRTRPAARHLGDLYEKDSQLALRLSWANARAIASELRDVGVTVDCAPVLDLPVSGAHDIIGDRAFARKVRTIAEIGQAMIDGFLDGGVLPVIKHIPGHGRARADSHLELPIVETSAAELEATDFAPFRLLNHAPMAMTAHVVYTAYDGSAPATASRRVIGDVIRKSIGYDGCLMSDDLSMKALTGSFADRAAAALAAGCDVILHCNGDQSEMTQIACATGQLDSDALRRTSAALAALQAPKPVDLVGLEAELERYFGAIA